MAPPLPPIIINASRDAAPLGIESAWFCWCERGPFRIAKVTAKFWFEARALGAAELGELVEFVDCAREARLAPRFGAVA